MQSNFSTCPYRQSSPEARMKRRRQQCLEGSSYHHVVADQLCHICQASVQVIVYSIYKLPLYFMSALFFYVMLLLSCRYIYDILLCAVFHIATCSIECIGCRFVSFITWPVFVSCCRTLYMCIKCNFCRSCSDHQVTQISHFEVVYQHTVHFYRNRVRAITLFHLCILQ